MRLEGEVTKFGCVKTEYAVPGLRIPAAGGG